jgi:hypothetical protein
MHSIRVILLESKIKPTISIKIFLAVFIYKQRCSSPLEQILLKVHSCFVFVRLSSSMSSYLEFFLVF